MPVPEEIRKVDRPKNTVVYDTGHEGPNRYCVRERAGTRYVPGGNPQPRNGKIIGHIYNGKYVPKVPEIATDGPWALSYGASILVKSVSSDIEDTLMRIYPIEDAYNIMAISMLRVLKPRVSIKGLLKEYKRTFISVFYPNAHLSPTTVSNLFERIGIDEAKRLKFFEYRTEAIEKEHKIAIDGTLKQDSSKINDLSGYSHKARMKGCKEISVIYAYDIETLEPICAQVFPGGYIDASAYSTFIKDNNISKGIIINDKGFPPDRIESELKAHKDLHFITPIKNNDTRIRDNQMLEFTGLLEGIGYDVWYKKSVDTTTGHYLYAFKDPDTGLMQEHGYCKKVRKAASKKNEKNEKIKYSDKEPYFGVIVFESDLDLNPSKIYKNYQDRWLLELVFKQYKSNLGLNKTNVQSDFAVLGSEFVNFIATVLSCRILRKASNAGLLDDLSYAELLDDLSSAWRKVDAPEITKSDDGFWVHAFKYVLEYLEALGLSIPAPKPETKKRGRHKKESSSKEKKSKKAGSKKNPLLPAL